MSRSSRMSLCMKIITIAFIFSWVTPLNFISSFSTQQAFAETSQIHEQASIVKTSTSLSQEMTAESTLPLSTQSADNQVHTNVKHIGKSNIESNLKPITESNNETNIKPIIEPIIEPKPTPTQPIAESNTNPDPQSPGSSESVEKSGSSESSSVNPGPKTSPEVTPIDETNSSSSSDAEPENESESEPELSAQPENEQTADTLEQESEEEPQPTSTRQKRSSTPSTWTTYEDTGKLMKETVWKKVHYPAKYEDHFVKQGVNECKEVPQFQDAWVDRTCTKVLDVWKDKWCTTYQDVWINYWNDGKGNWGGGKYERQSKQVYCGAYERQTTQEYCGGYERRTTMTQQCAYKDTSYWEKRKVKDAETKDEVVSVNWLTYDQYYAKLPEKKPKFPVIQGNADGNSNKSGIDDSVVTEAVKESIADVALDLGCQAVASILNRYTAGLAKPIMKNACRAVNKAKDGKKVDTAKKGVQESKSNTKGTSNISELRSQGKPYEKHTTVTGRNLPTISKPNSSVDLYDENGKLKQRRYYDENGRDLQDIDYEHSNGDNSHDFPHTHMWDWSNGSPKRSK